MENSIQFKTETLNIITEIVKSPSAVGRYRGEEVFEIVNQRVNDLSPDSLLIIDIREANPLQYVFCQYAFGPLLKVLHEKGSENKRFLFQMHEHHRSCFFRGVLKHIDKTIPRNESFNAFIESDMFTLLMIGEEKEIQYISKFNKIETDLLNLINEAENISGREIIDSKKLFDPDSIVDSLRSLNHKGFIVHIKNEIDQYYSINEYLK